VHTTFLTRRRLYEKQTCLRSKCDSRAVRRKEKMKEGYKQHPIRESGIKRRNPDDASMRKQKANPIEKRHAVCERKCKNPAQTDGREERERHIQHPASPRNVSSPIRSPSQTGPVSTNAHITSCVRARVRSLLLLLSSNVLSRLLGCVSVVVFGSLSFHNRA
jgi:hypothetical protein